MIGTFNIMLTHGDDGEWISMPPFAAGTPIDKISEGAATAGAMIVITDTGNAKAILEKLAAKLMDEVNQKNGGA